MYDVAKAYVRDGASLTESIHCLRGVKQGDSIHCLRGVKQGDSIHCLCGVKQGDVWSPILFLLFINVLVLDIIKGSKHGATLTSTSVEIFILLFADDILLSETAIG